MTILKLQQPPILAVKARPDGAISIIRPPGSVEWGTRTRTNAPTNEGTETHSGTQTHEGTSTDSGTTTGTSSRFYTSGRPGVVDRRMTTVNARRLISIGTSSLVFDPQGTQNLVDRDGKVVRSGVEIEITDAQPGATRPGKTEITGVSYPNPEGPLPPIPTPGPDGPGPVPGVGQADDDDSDEDGDSDNSSDSDDAGDSDNARDSEPDTDDVAREGILVGFQGTGIEPPLAPHGLRAEPGER